MNSSDYSFNSRFKASTYTTEEGANALSECALAGQMLRDAEWLMERAEAL